MLINHLINNGKQNLTWLDLAIQFNIKPNKTAVQRTKAANDIWRRYQKKCEKGLCTERCTLTGCGSFVNKENEIVKGLDTDIPAGMKISKKWQGAGGNWLYSFAAEKGAIDTETREKLIEDLKNFSPKSVKKLRPQAQSEDAIMYQINLPDFHVGRLPADQTRTLFLTLISELMDRAKNETIERIVLPIGNDFLNTDTVVPTPRGSGYLATTAGTAQFDIGDQQDTFKTAWSMLIEAITFLATIAPVYVINVPGNHDKNRSQYLTDVIYAWFHNDDNVFVDNTKDVFKFHQYGSNLNMYHHGDKIKAADFPLIMATEQPQAFADCDFKEVHVGHLHKNMQDEYRGIQIKHLPSAAPNSRWEESSGYKHRRAVIGMKFHPTAGMVGTDRINLK